MTDNNDEPTKEELQSRVEQLEQTVSQMLPSRRDALKLGGTALGAAALGSTATGGASAGTDQAGTIGTSNKPVDIEAEDINAEAVNTDILNTDWAIDAGDYGDLQSALNDADSMNINHIIIPPGTYAAVNPYPGQILTGQGSALNSDVVIDGGGAAAINDANVPNNAIIQNCELKNNSGSGQSVAVVDAAGVKFIDCYVSGSGDRGLDLRGGHCQVRGCDFGDGSSITNESVLLRSGAENCTVRNNTRTGTINDSGTGNDVGGNS